MNTIYLASIPISQSGRVTIGQNRRGPALLAILLPLVTVFFIVGGFFRSDFNIELLMMHSIMLFLFPVGLIVLVYWCMRYIRPAIRALNFSDPPVYLSNGYVFVLGQKYIIEKGTSLEFNRSVISILSNGREVVRVPSYFITVRRNLRHD